jgi:hypothetical protein
MTFSMLICCVILAYQYYQIPHNEVIELFFVAVLSVMTAIGELIKAVEKK